MVTMGIFSLQRKIPMVEPGIEPENSWSVVKNSDHEAGHVVEYTVSCFIWV
jgi:hypothetical protein